MKCIAIYQLGVVFKQFCYIKCGCGDVVNGMKTNRMNWQKKFIKEKFNKGELRHYDELESEFDNMAKNGFNWIWDSGKIRLRYKSE